MTLVTLRPTSTISNTGTLDPTSGSAHAALNDDDDTTYVNLSSGDVVSVGVADLTLPSGAVIKVIGVRARWSPDSLPSPGLRVMAGPVAKRFGGTFYGTSQNIVESTFGERSDLSDSDVDASTISMECIGGPPGDVMIAHEAYLDVTYVEIPVVTVDNPAGTLTTTNIPLVSWSDALDSDGGSQEWYEVKIFTSAVYGGGGFNPATATPVTESLVQASSDGFWQIEEALSNGTYRAYVRVAQTVNGAQHWSAFAFSQFTITVTAPSAPTITATPEDDMGRIEVEITHAGGLSSDLLELQRSNDAGVTWFGVRHPEGIDVPITGPDATIEDYEAPNSIEVTYRARALHIYSGDHAASAWATATGTWTAAVWWVKHPNLPDLNVQLADGASGPVTRASRGGIYQPLGAALPIAVKDTRAGAQGSVILTAETQADLDAIDALLDTVGTMLLQAPPISGEPDRYVSFGDQSSARIIDKAALHMRSITLPWIQVAKPLGAQIFSLFLIGLLTWGINAGLVFYTLDGSGTKDRDWGINGDGIAYYDTAGPAPGEEATPFLDLRGFGVTSGHA